MSEHECSGTDCASLVRIKALERTLEDEGALTLSREDLQPPWGLGAWYDGCYHPVQPDHCTACHHVR